MPGRDELGDALLGPHRGDGAGRRDVGELRAGPGVSRHPTARSTACWCGPWPCPIRRWPGFFGIVADVSRPGRRAVDHGRRRASASQLLVEHSPDGIIVHQDGLIVYTNPAAAAHGGARRRPRRLGRPITLVHHPDDLGKHDGPAGRS